MASDGPDPPPCDRELWETGVTVLVTHSIPSNALERWVKSVAELSGQRVDWGFVGGRARVVALGDIAAVHEALVALRDEHDRLYREADGGIDPRARPPWGVPE